MNLFNHCMTVVGGLHLKHPTIQLHNFTESLLADYGIVSKFETIPHKFDPYIKDPPYRDDAENIYR